jgi:hypothetical protein
LCETSRLCLRMLIELTNLPRCQILPRQNSSIIKGKRGQAFCLSLEERVLSLAQFIAKSSQRVDAILMLLICLKV